MHHDFDKAAKEILGLSGRAIIPFLNACFSASHPRDAPVTRSNTEFRFPSKKAGSGGKTIIADEIFLVGEGSAEPSVRYHLEIQLDRRAGMALRMFRYAAADALDHPGEEDGVQTITFPQSLVIYLEPPAGTPDYEPLRVRFPGASCYEYRTPVIKLPELSVAELAERHLLIFAPLYILRLRKRVKGAKKGEERRMLAAELKKICGELGEALRREEELGNMTAVDGDKILEMTDVLHKEIYGEYTEFEEERMDFSSLRVIEKLHEELDEAVSRAELDRRRLRDTARNILRLGLSVEQVSQATGLPPETVQELAVGL
jgi:hypothetical protein